jgi:tetratricopeptide (TPR) repeat protein
MQRINNRAHVYLKKGAADKAIEILIDAKQRARRLVGRDQRVRVLTTAVECHKLLGDAASAIRRYKELESTSRATGDRKKQIEFLMGLGKCYRDNGQMQLSIEYRRRAIAVAEAIRDYGTAGLLSAMIANTYHKDVGQPRRARPYYRAAIEHLQKSGDLETARQLVGRLAECEAFETEGESTA